MNKKIQKYFCLGNKIIGRRIMPWSRGMAADFVARHYNKIYPSVTVSFRRRMFLRIGLTAFFLSVSLCVCREIEINILHTTDLHGHLEAVLSGESKKPSGGLLRCAALIEKIRRENPNVLLIDCGDLFQGSVESYLTRGEVMMKAVKYLRYDALVAGNHEFDWGVERLRMLYQQAEIPVLAANIRGTKDVPIPWTQPFLLKEIEGVKVVIVGLTTPLIPKWSMPRLLGDLQFDESVKTLRRVLPEARKLKPDILILAVHQGWRQWGDDQANAINKIAKTFPDFSLIIGAHTHQAIEAQEIKGIVYTQAGYYGLWLGKVNLRYDDERHRVTKIEPRLLAVEADIPPEKDLRELTADDLKKTKSYLAEKVGANEAELLPESKMPGQSGVQTLIAAAMAAAVDAEVVFHGTLSSAGLPAGAVRMADVWRIVPYENTIAKAMLTLEEIREILEENSRYYGKSQFRGVSGITYELKPKAPVGERVANVRLSSGREIKNGQRIALAVNSYDLASAGDRFPRLREIMERPESRLEETDKDTRAAVIEYIKNHSPLKIEVAPGAMVGKGRKTARAR